MLFEEVVDGTLEHERVVDGDQVHALDAEPTWLSATSDRLVHHVVGDEEEGLELGTKGTTISNSCAQGHQEEGAEGEACVGLTVREG